MRLALPANTRAKLARVFSRSWWNQRRIMIVAVVSVVLAASVIWYFRVESMSYRIEERMLTVQSGPDGNKPISLDTSLFVPKGANNDDQRPAVLLAHGFGSDKDGVTQEARRLVRDGYVVLAWTARGFGKSGGKIHLNDPDYEVTDARRLIDWLAKRPEVQQDQPGDPHVGVVGGSYGGALALLLSAYDGRVDAIVPSITWNNLANSLFPEATGADALNGVFKRLWAGIFFGSVDSSDNGREQNPQCGRFAADICQMYLNVATTGRATPEAVALLERVSPSSVLNRIKSPTLLIQGTNDTLFGVDQANANERGIAAAGTPVRVAWFSGGHGSGSGSPSDRRRVTELTNQWLDYYLRDTGDPPAMSFTYSRLVGVRVNTQSSATVGYSADAYPGLNGGKSEEITVKGAAREIANPPNSTPAPVSFLPGLGALPELSTTVERVLGEIDGQHVNFDSAALTKAITVVGAPQIQLRAASPTGEAVLFIKLYDVASDDEQFLSNSLIAAVRLQNLPSSLAEAKPVTVRLPGIAHRFESGHRLRVTVSTADQTYIGLTNPTTYTVALGASGTSSALQLPTVVSTRLTSDEVGLWWVLIILLGLITVIVVAVIVIAQVRHHRKDRSVTSQYANTPLVVNGLRKAYRDGFLAVSDISFTVERGQVVGLLGPNGAGKTTSLRVILGLTMPTAGEVFIFGHRLAPGAPVLSQLGSLVEGPGFLPHLSGLDNLQLYWRATGRPTDDARFDDVLAVAALGNAIHRKVRAYSHGMKQRLAIAQAMLGMPHLLILDEPTDGLDPPQIAQMREVLHNYATDGRAVLVSSHLLAEVEQTCTHVVVVNRGRVAAAGPVDKVIGDSPTARFDVSDPDAAINILNGLPGVDSVWREDQALIAELSGVPRSVAVAALVQAGIDVDRVVPRRRLEDAFLSLVSEDKP